MTAIIPANLTGSVHFAPANTITPAVHLAPACVAAYRTDLVGGPVVKVAFVGDSNLTVAPTQTFSRLDGTAGQILRAFRQANPFVTFTPLNYAYGGATFTSINFTNIQAMIDAGFVLGAWATGNELLTMYQLVAAAGADIVVIMSGINDEKNFVPAARLAVEQGFAAACPNTAIIWATGPQFSGSSNYANASLTASQIGATSVAQLLATNAVQTRTAWIDLHRTHMALVEGVDIARPVMIDGTPPAQAITTPATLAGLTDFDFDLSLVFTGTFTNRKLRVIGSYIGVNGSSFIEIVPNTGTGKLDVVFGFLNIGIEGGRTTFPTTVNIPASGAVTVTISLRGAHALVDINGVECVSAPVGRLGGTFAPQISWVATAGSPSLAQAMTATYRRFAYERTFGAMTEQQALGSVNTSDAVTGGNDINHWTTRAMVEIVQRTLAALDLHLPVLTQGSSIFPGTDSPFVGLGAWPPMGMFHVQGLGLTGYTPPAGQNTMMISDATVPRLTMAAGDAGAAAIYAGSPSDPDAFRMTYSMATGVTAFWTAGAEVARLINPSVDTFTGLQIVSRVSGVSTIQQVSTSPVGSVPVGARVLIVGP